MPLADDVERTVAVDVGQHRAVGEASSFYTARGEFLDRLDEQIAASLDAALLAVLSSDWRR